MSSQDEEFYDFMTYVGVFPPSGCDHFDASVDDLACNDRYFKALAAAETQMTFMEAEMRVEPSWATCEQIYDVLLFGIDTLLDEGWSEEDATEIILGGTRIYGNGSIRQVMDGC